jgi:D-alanine--poly(phosphoribitol) ligase subunit 2
MEKREIEKIIYSVIDELNEDLGDQNKLEKSKSTILLGKGAQIDSLGFVNLVASIEDHIEEETGLVLTLVNENSISVEPSPFRTIETLVEYMLSCL